ncbi:MAG: hypothetical protein M1825_000429 [Sarcosagium campestre]|nr:MAG: hypothetical protein M1825_000429 [Sarcosagium campestre]
MSRAAFGYDKPKNSLRRNTLVRKHDPTLAGPHDCHFVSTSPAPVARHGALAISPQSKLSDERFNCKSCNEARAAGAVSCRISSQPFPVKYQPCKSNLSDKVAADWVISYYTNRHLNPRQLHAEQKLMRLVKSSPLNLDDVPEVLELADFVFFEGVLSSRVERRWSDLAAECSDESLIGTTELCEDKYGDFRTRISLSRPLLQSDAYGQRLVLSALFHEAIHSYLFIRRGHKATKNGGHSTGFKRIAELIDTWVGDREYLQLYNTEAALDRFETTHSGWDEESQTWGKDHKVKWTMHKMKPNLEPRRRDGTFAACSSRYERYTNHDF